MSDADRIAELELALAVSMKAHTPYISGDSRCIPDWFVACAAVQADCSNDETMPILQAEMALPDFEPHEVPQRLTVTFEGEDVHE